MGAMGTLDVLRYILTLEGHKDCEREITSGPAIMEHQRGSSVNKMNVKHELFERRNQYALLRVGEACEAQ